MTKLGKSPGEHKKSFQKEENIAWDLQNWSLSFQTEGLGYVRTFKKILKVKAYKMLKKYQANAC